MTSFLIAACPLPLHSDLVIGGCDGLKSLQGLNSLTTIGGDLILNSNLALPSVDGLQVRPTPMLASVYIICRCDPSSGARNDALRQPSGGRPEHPHGLGAGWEMQALRIVGAQG